jgi:hypothetical protein
MTTESTPHFLIIVTKPFPGETEPQKWIVQPQCYFSVEQGRLGDDYPVRKYLEKYTATLGEVRLFPIAPGAEIKEHIHPIQRGTRPYSPGNPQAKVAPFTHRKRELPEFCFECKTPNMPVREGYCFPRPGYDCVLTPGQREALVEAFAEELTQGVIALAPEILKRIRQQVIDKLREQANEAHQAAQKAEDLAKTLATQFNLD